MRCGRDCSGVTSAMHVFWSFEDENSLPAEMSSDCVNYMSGHIDTKYLDQAFWCHGWMTAFQSPKSVTSATMELPTVQISYKHCLSQYVDVMGLTHSGLRA